MKVKILRAGVYLDETLKAKKRQAGDFLETGEHYGHALIADDLAIAVSEAVPQPKKVTGKSKKSGKTTNPPAGKKNSGPGNPFLV